MRWRVNFMMPSGRARSFWATRKAGTSPAQRSFRRSLMKPTISASIYFFTPLRWSPRADPRTHEKGKITTATKAYFGMPIPWGDCDAEKYAGSDPTEAAKHYLHEGQRVHGAITTGLNQLGITPCAVWRSGAGWQFLIKLDHPIEPAEAETLVGKLHMRSRLRSGSPKL